MRVSSQAIAIVIAALLALSGCASGSDSSQVASGPATPVATTPPLAMPAVLDQGQPDTTNDGPAATTVPLEVPVETEPTAAVASAPTPIATEAPTAVPAPAPTEAAAPAATEVPATAAAPTATAAPQASAPAPAAPAATAPTGTGSTIALGDFDVVNLVTQADQNIAQLAPSGATLLWFWSPH